jgi:hypothetical protein
LNLFAQVGRSTIHRDINLLQNLNDVNRLREEVAVKLYDITFLSAITRFLLPVMDEEHLVHHAWLAEVVALGFLLVGNKATF